MDASADELLERMFQIRDLIDTVVFPDDERDSDKVHVRDVERIKDLLICLLAELGRTASDDKEWERIHRHISTAAVEVEKVVRIVRGKVN
jgi:hypothetical protein